MSKTTLHQLADVGQSVWLDYINRSMLETGKLKNLIDQGLRGMTSNPTIFEKVITSSSDYDKDIIRLKESGKSTFEIYDELTIKDIQGACDQFSAVFKNTKGLDGYVSLEINPQLANKVEEQTKEGLRLFKKVNRPNLMIKVPSTVEGVKVVEELLAEGVNVNVTLIFSLEQYRQTASAYLKGLARYSRKNPDLSNVRSVASVFVSRIDSLIDPKLDQMIQAEKDPSKKKELESLLGKAAVANCTTILEESKKIFTSKEFNALTQKNAHLQRVLWGSTSTKNPKYNDVKYVAELIAPQTVNTIPENTLMAFIDHGVVKDAFNKNSYKNARTVIDKLRGSQIHIENICQQLLADGCKAFIDSFDTLIKAIEKKAQVLVGK